MQTNLSNRNSSIDIFRYFCSLLVVLIHAHPFADINFNADYIVSTILPRIGVPFFFAVAGFFYIQKLESNLKVFIPYIKRLLQTYFIWTLIYYAIDFFSWGYGQLKGFIVTGTINFLIKGSYYHFWFFPAIIFCVCFTTLLFKLKLNKIIIPLSIILYIIGCLGCSYFQVTSNLPILGVLYNSEYFTLIRRIFLMGFPFFVSGYAVYKIKNKILNKLSNTKLLTAVVLSVILWLAEIYAVLKLGLSANIIITFALYPMVIITLMYLLKNPLPQCQKLAGKCRCLANFTYYSHPLALLVLNNFNMPKLVIFFITVIIIFILGSIIYKINNRYLNYIVN